MEKVELHHLYSYLPHGLNGIIGNIDVTLFGVSDKRNDGYWIFKKDNTTYAFWGKGRVKLKLRPLSLFKDIKSNEMKKLNWDLSDQIELSEFANNKFSVPVMHYYTFNLCCINHIDLYGLIDKGLAVPCNRFGF